MTKTVLRTACIQKSYTKKRAKGCKNPPNVPNLMSSFSEEVAAQELGATLTLCGNHVAANTLGTSGHRYPGDSVLHCACADL